MTKKTIAERVRIAILGVCTLLNVFMAFVQKSLGNQAAAEEAMWVGAFCGLFFVVLLIYTD